MSLSIESKWPSKLGCVALSSVENYWFAPLNNLSGVYIYMYKYISNVFPGLDDAVRASCPSKYRPL